MEWCLIPADGIALGAAASTSQVRVEMIIFAAIMLHKVLMMVSLINGQSFKIFVGFEFKSTLVFFHDDILTMNT